MRRRVAGAALSAIVLVMTCVIFTALLAGGLLAEAADRVGR